MKRILVLLFIGTFIFSTIFAQDVYYKIPKKLEAEDFQLPQDKENQNGHN